MDLVVSPGVTLSISLGAPRFVAAVGVECSVIAPFAPEYWTDRGGAGGVAQAQIFTDGSLRVALGAQVGSFAGLELGVAMRTGTARRPFALALHVAPYLSLGYAYVSYDFNLTLNRGVGAPPIEHFLHFGLKLPVVRALVLESTDHSYPQRTVGREWRVYVPRYNVRK